LRGAVLVTGGAGFIGGHIAAACRAAGRRVIVLDDFSTGERDNVPEGAELIGGDLRDPSVLDEALKRGDVEVISHHAAQIDVRRSVADPAADADVNVVGTLRLLERARTAGVKHVIFASTGGAIYGEVTGGAQSEDSPTVPVSPYGCAKLSVEHYLHYYRVVHGLSSVALRYGNVYGPRQNSMGEAGVVAIFASRLRDGETLFVNGTGEQTRDYVFVEDVVRANVAAMERRLEGHFNVGTGVETSVLQIVTTLEQVSGKKARIEHREAKKGEQQRSLLDGSRLRNTAGLASPVPLSEGLARTWQWFADR
jgi:UDP-glucose 4-epimerase